MSNYTWHPDYGRPFSVPPAVGDLIGWEHTVWRVVDVQNVPEDRWTDRDRTMVKSLKPAYRKTAEPVMVIVRPVAITSEDVRARDHDKHLRHRHGATWHVYPDGHYPVCVQCGEPTPCREVMAEYIAKQMMQRMSRYETPGMCPHCEKVVTARQRSRTFHENLEIPGGPPVTFHLSRNCYNSALDYERQWAAADPEHRKTTLSCRGHVTNHNDGTYDCTAMDDCPGPGVYHQSYSVCSCPDCHARGQFNCHPSPAARRKGDTSDLFGDAA